MYNAAAHKKFLELRAAGLSFNKIVGELGISKPTLIKWGQKYDEEIRALKAKELLTEFTENVLREKERIILNAEWILRIERGMVNVENKGTAQNKILNKFEMLLGKEIDFINLRFHKNGNLNEIVFGLVKKKK
ncbi:MAG: hypothetical protein WC879_05205 [Melioribacteraceae bacterium]